MTFLLRIKMAETPKELSEEVGLLSAVEQLGNDRATTIPTNEPHVPRAHNNAESVNAKLSPRESSSIRG